MSLKENFLLAAENTFLLKNLRAASDSEILQKTSTFLRLAYFGIVGERVVQEKRSLMKGFGGLGSSFP